jgi:hypothetical protein
MVVAVAVAVALGGWDLDFELVMETHVAEANEREIFALHGSPKRRHIFRVYASHM